MSAEILNYADFVRMMIDALEAAEVEYLIGGAVAAWAWGEQGLHILWRELLKSLRR